MTEIEISGQDTEAEVVVLKETTRAQDDKIKTLSAQMHAKSERRGDPVEKKPITVCTNHRKVTGILRTFSLSLLISNVKRVLLHSMRAPTVQVNTYRTRAITQKDSRNPRSF